MSERVSVVVKVVARPDAGEPMRKLVLRLAAESRKETGCILYEVLQNNAEPNVFILYEQ